MLLPSTKYILTIELYSRVGMMALSFWMPNSISATMPPLEYNSIILTVVSDFLIENSLLDDVGLILQLKSECFVVIPIH